MKNRKKYILLLMLFLSATLGSYGKVLFFDTWHQIFDMKSVGFVYDSSVIMETPYELYFLKEEGEYDETYIDDHMAALWNDSIWLINSKYLKKNFSGDGSLLRGYVPFYFDERVAYAVYKPIMKSFCNEEFYYIDFQKADVRKVSHKYLSVLLKNYPDLLMRYEGMKDNKKPRVIEEFFLKYIDRASQDYMRPCIVDIIN